MTQTTMLGRKIEVAGHQAADSGDLMYVSRPSARFIIAGGEAREIVSLQAPASARQLDAAADAARGRRPQLAVTDLGAVEVRLDAAGRKMCYLPGTECEVGYSD